MTSKEFERLKPEQRRVYFETYKKKTAKRWHRLNASKGNPALSPFVTSSITGKK